MERSVSLTSLLRYLQLLRQNQKIMYLLVGAVNTVIGVSLFFLLYYLLHDVLHYQFITVIAHFMSVLSSWLLYRHFVFKSDAPAFIEYIKFNVSSLLMLGFHMFGLLVLVDLCHLHPMVSQPIVVVIAIIVSYVLHSKFTFSRLI